MTITSRTPEEAPRHCPVCSDLAVVVPSLETWNAPCPNCGQLLWFSKYTVSLLPHGHPLRVYLEEKAGLIIANGAPSGWHFDLSMTDETDQTLKEVIEAMSPRNRRIIELRLQGKTVGDIDAAFQSLQGDERKTYPPVSQATIRRVIRETQSRIRELIMEE